MTSADESVGQQHECLDVVRVVAEQLAAQPYGVAAADSGAIDVHRTARRSAESSAGAVEPRGRRRGVRGVSGSAGLRGGGRALNALEANDLRVDAGGVNHIGLRGRHH